MGSFWNVFASATAALALFAGCADRGGEGPAPSNDTPSAEECGTFASGIYHGRPSAQGGFELQVVGGQLSEPVPYDGVGFDLDVHTHLSVKDDQTYARYTPSCATRRVVVPGVYHPGRPSLSPEGDRAVVQGLAASVITGGSGDDFNIYLVNLTSGAHQRLSPLSVNEESPEWIPGTERVLWSSFDPEAGIDVHVFDLASNAEVLRIPGAGAIHLDVSADGTRLLDPGRLRIYDLATGDQLADLHAEAVAQVTARGFELDTRFPGQANRGTFPLDGSFSPDGTSVVFDGAVRRDGDYGVILARMRIDGTAFEVLSGLIDVDPASSNNHNFSRLSPTWI